MDGSAFTKQQVDEFIRWVFAEDSEGLGGSVKGAVSNVTLLVSGAVVEVRLVRTWFHVYLVTYQMLALPVAILPS